MNMGNCRRMDLKVSRDSKRLEEKYFEHKMMDRINNSGIRSKNIKQDYYDCIYEGCYDEDAYTYGLNW